MKLTSVVRSTGAAGIALAAAIGLSASPAFAAAQVQHQNGSIPAGFPWDLGPSPVGLPPSCQFPNGDANFVFGSGTYVSHGTSNANGDWGGMTLEGPALFFEDTTQIAQGHLTVWEGGGNNAKGQNEGGLTVDFGGTTLTGGTVQIHVNGQMTIPANSSTGVPTANVTNVEVSCS